MKVGWGTYPNNLGHVFFPGCFRCHDDNHKSRDGNVIKQDCESCHDDAVDRGAMRPSRES